MNLMEIDWPSVGVTIAGFLATIVGIVNWLKKNIVNVQQLRNDGADLSVQTKYFKAMLKDNDMLKTEISNSKIQMKEVIKVIKAKDDEIEELKNEMRELVMVVKEATSSGLYK